MSKTVTSRFVLRGDNQLNSAFSKAQRQLGDLSQRAALFAAAAIAGGAAIVRAQSQQIDVLAKTSDALGVTTENLQTLHTMGELAGVGANDLDKKLGKLQKNLGEIARRGGTMAEALEDAGLKIKDVIDLPADAQFEAIAKALAGIENQTLRVSIASDLFGRDANKLLKLTDQLAKDGLGKLRAELEALGFLITRSEAAGVERMNDSMEIASKVAAGVAQKFTVTLAPAIAAIAEAFTDAARESSGFDEEIEDSVDSIVTSIGFVVDVVDSVGRAFKIASRLGIVAFEGLKVGVAGVADSIINGPNRAINLLLQQLDKLPGVDIDFQIPEIAPGLALDLETSKRIVSQAMADIDAILLETQPSEIIRRRMENIRAELANFTPDARPEGGGADIIDEGKPSGTETAAIETARLRNDLQREYAQLISSTRTAAEAHNEQITRVDELYISGVIPSAEAYADLLERINGRFEETLDKADEVNNKMTEFAVQGARNMQTALADYLFDPVNEGFDGMLEGFAKTLQRMAAEAAASAIFNAIFSAMGSSSTGWVSALGNSLAGARAEGGPVSGGSAYLVGERGPEIIVPRNAGMVIPNNQIGGSSVTVNIDARETENPGRLLALVPVIQQQIERSMEYKMRRGIL